MFRINKFDAELETGCLEKMSKLLIFNTFLLMVKKYILKIMLKKLQCKIKDTL